MWRLLARLPWPKARRATDRALRQFRTELADAREAGDRAALEALLGRPAALGLANDDVAVELEEVQGLLEAADLAAEIAAVGSLPVMVTQHRALGADVCHFAAPACLGGLSADDPGKLFLTNRRVLFLGSRSLAFSWPEVSRFERAGRELIVLTRERPRATELRLNTFSDAARAAVIAAELLGRARTA